MDNDASNRRSEPNDWGDGMERTVEPGAEMSEQEADDFANTQLRDAWVRELYTEEGAVIWIADAEKKNHSLEKQLERLAQLRDGAYA